jgi:hypothetical protein
MAFCSISLSVVLHFSASFTSQVCVSISSVVWIARLIILQPLGNVINRFQDQNNLFFDPLNKVHILRIEPLTFHAACMEKSEPGQVFFDHFFLGLPRCFPFAFAASIPLLWRSFRRRSSNFAIPICSHQVRNCIGPLFQFESQGSVKDLNSTCLLSSSSKNRISSTGSLPRRSSR